MKLYDELAEWWPLLSSPDDYEEEAGLYLRALADAATGPLDGQTIWSRAFAREAPFRWPEPQPAPRCPGRLSIPGRAPFTW
jgi:hypothetical protein